MFEMLLNSRKKLSLETPLKGDLDLGYFGQVDSKNFITGDVLASKIGLTIGTSTNSSGGWLKFSRNKKIIYISKKILRTYVSWADIYNVGAVYGDNTVGKCPLPTQRLQNSVVTIDGRNYAVRLMSVSDTDPNTALALADGGTGIPPGGELTSLFFKVMASRDGIWDSIADADLSMELPSGSVTSLINWGIEANKSTTSTYRLNFTRVTTSASTLGRVDYNTRSTTSSSAMVWRPVLELIP